MDNTQQNLNQNQNKESAPAESPMPVAPEKPSKSNIGALIGSLVLVAVLLVGGLYVWGSRLSDREETANQTLSSEQEEKTEESSEDAGAVSESDDLVDIEDELAGTEFEGSADLDLGFEAEEGPFCLEGKNLSDRKS